MDKKIEDLDFDECLDELEFRWDGYIWLKNRAEKVDEELGLIITTLLDRLYSLSNQNNIYWEFCTLKTYKHLFGELYNSYLSEYPDGNLVDFCNDELNGLVTSRSVYDRRTGNHIGYRDLIMSFYDYDFSDLPIDEKKYGLSQDKKIEFLDNLIKEEKEVQEIGLSKYLGNEESKDFFEIKTYYSFNEFESNFESDFSKYNKTYIDASKENFINDCLKHYEIGKENIIVLEDYNITGKPIKETKNVLLGVDENIQNYIKDGEGEFSYIKIKSLTITFSKIIDFLEKQTLNHRDFPILSIDENKNNEYGYKDEQKHESESFMFFDKIRHGDLGEFDMIIGLREITQNYDVELLKSLSSDLSLYFFIEKEDMEYSFSPEHVEKTINKYKEEGLEIPYHKRIPFESLNDRQKEYRKKHEEKHPYKPSIDLEELLFPFEFYDLHTLDYNIDEKIKTLYTEDKIVEPVLNYPDTSGTEKIIFLHKMGVLEYLRTKEPFNLSTNKLAEYLSAITGMKVSTVQSYINPIINENSGQKNNPLNNKNKVKEVEQKLIQMSCNINDFIT